MNVPKIKKVRKKREQIRDVANLAKKSHCQGETPDANITDKEINPRKKS